MTLPQRQSNKYRYSRESDNHLREKTNVRKAFPSPAAIFFQIATFSPKLARSRCIYSMLLLGAHARRGLRRSRLYTTLTCRIGTKSTKMDRTCNSNQFVIPKTTYRGRTLWARIRRFHIACWCVASGHPLHLMVGCVFARWSLDNLLP